MAKKETLRKYTASLTVRGEVQRIVMAASENDAKRKLKKMMFGEDGQSPKSSALAAFCWDADDGFARLHWSERTEEEREKAMIRVMKNISKQDGDSHDESGMDQKSV